MWRHMSSPFRATLPTHHHACHYIRSHPPACRALLGVFAGFIPRNVLWPNGSCARALRPTMAPSLEPSANIRNAPKSDGSCERHAFAEALGPAPVMALAPSLEPFANTQSHPLNLLRPLTTFYPAFVMMLCVTIMMCRQQDPRSAFGHYERPCTSDQHSTFNFWSSTARGETAGHRLRSLLILHFGIVKCVLWPNI